MAERIGLPFDEVPESRGSEVPESRSPEVLEVPLTVSELTAHLKALVEEGFGRIEVEGQVSNHRPHPSGHLYFTLKDSSAQIRAVMFRSDARRMTFRLEDGQHIVARG